jgi:hypothetical protein
LHYYRLDDEAEAVAAEAVAVVGLQLSDLLLSDLLLVLVCGPVLLLSD